MGSATPVRVARITAPSPGSKISTGPFHMPFRDLPEYVVVQREGGREGGRVVRKDYEGGYFFRCFVTCVYVSRVSEDMLCIDCRRCIVKGCEDIYIVFYLSTVLSCFRTRQKRQQVWLWWSLL